MELVNVRMEVSSKTSAEVSYLAKRLGISKKVTYNLIVSLFLYERDLFKAYTNLKTHYGFWADRLPDDKPDDVPF